MAAGVLAIALGLLGIRPACATASLRDESNTAESLQLRGEQLLAKGENAAALAALNQSIRLDPDYPRALHQRAEAHFRLGNLDAAIADVDRCLRLRRPGQDFSGTVTVRLKVYHRRGEFEKMLADAEEALRQSPRLSASFDNRGVAYHSLGDDQKACADYTRALAINPKNATALKNRALSLSRLGKWREAAADYNATLAARPNDADAHSGYAWMLATAPDDTVRNAREALAHAQRACELSAWIDSAKLDTLAAACAEAGRFDEAVSWQQKALAIMKRDRPETAEEYSARLRVYQQNQPYRGKVKVAVRSP